MKIVNYDGTRDRQVLTGMIVNAKVLAEIAKLWKQDGCFGSEIPNMIGGLAVKFWQDRGQAPGKIIEDLLEAHTANWHDKTKFDQCERLLSAISDEYERGDEINEGHLIDVAAKLFQEVNCRKTAQLAMGYCEAGQIEKATETLGGFTRVQLGTTARINPLKDKEARSRWFAQAAKPLLRYQGALGQFMLDSLSRGKFIAFLAPEKTGKSMVLLDIAWRLVLKRKRVAFFEVGDMTESQVGLRWGSRAAKKPYRSTNPDMSWPCTIKWPTEITGPAPGDDFASSRFEERRFDGPLTEEELTTACERIIKTKIRSNDDFFLWECHPTASISAQGIRSKLIEWQREINFAPDCLIVDYADILAPPPGRLDFRDQIDSTWKTLRRLSQEFHCLVVTATQANRDAYDRMLIGRKNISDDKRKFSHVDGLIAINVCGEEKERSVCRWNWIGGRDTPYGPTVVVHIAQCLPLAAPTVLSCWSKPK